VHDEILELAGRNADIPLNAGQNPARQTTEALMAEFQTRTYGTSAGLAIDAGLRAHMNKVYGTMSVGTLLTAGVSWAVGTSPALISVMINPATGGMTILGWIAFFLPLVMVFGFGAVLTRFSAAAAQLFFYAYAAAIGLQLSFLFLAYTGGSIATTFLSTAVGFAGLSLYGYTTKRDLSPLGSFLNIGVWGLLGAMIINMFLHSPAIDFAVSAIGVLIFAGLTAWDTQAIKSNYIENARSGNEEWMAKSAIMGALKLYMDFINMFLFLLRFMGDRR
jgi:FtsH-binding integral membrane protein